MLTIYWFLLIIFTILVLSAFGSKCVRVILLILLLLPLFVPFAFVVLKHDGSSNQQKNELFAKWTAGLDARNMTGKPDDIMAEAQKGGAKLVEFLVGMSENDTSLVVLTRNGSGNVGSFVEHHLKSVLRNAQDLSVLLMLDVSQLSYLQDRVALIELLKAEKLLSTTVVSTDSVVSLYSMRQADDDVITGFDWRMRPGKASNLWDRELDQATRDVLWALVRNLALPKFLGVDILLASYTNIDSQFVDAAKKEHIHIAVRNATTKSVQDFFFGDLKLPFLNQLPSSTAQETGKQPRSRSQMDP